jgi:2,3,4,5-tetrahydropyridine-2-carboxylate N-succinyltransferase
MITQNLDWKNLLNELEKGTLRCATPPHTPEGQWVVNQEVKQGILQAFKAGELVVHGEFIDKHNLLPRQFTLADKIRLVPGGTSVRRGAYLAPGVIVMPPSYINVGAYVDEGTMVDSHALVGSCAQIGKRVHLSAAVQIGGVLEPIGMQPVIIEDDVFVGAGSVIVEGIRVKHGAVIAPGVILSKAVSVYDCVQEKILPPGEIPAGAVVVPGVRKMSQSNKFITDQGLHLQCPLIIKYRDAKTNTSLVLEEALR